MLVDRVAGAANGRGYHGKGFSQDRKEGSPENGREGKAAPLRESPKTKPETGRMTMIGDWMLETADSIETIVASTEIKGSVSW